MANNNDVVLENGQFRLIVGCDGITKSLICKESYEELLAAGEEISLFSVTQERPFNNEIKLAHPNKRTTFQANAVKREGDKLIVGFEIIPYKAVVEIKETPAYIAFALSDFIVEKSDYNYLKMSLPPAVEMRFLQIPVRNKTNFGEWLNVSWDDKSAAGVIAASPHTRADAERRKGYRVMSADAVKGIKLKGACAALIAGKTGKFLDNVAKFEEDYNLPRGAESRRGDMINASYYWSADLTPANVDEHIKYAKMGGFKLMLLYYTCIFESKGGYGLTGNYDAGDYRKEYPNGRDDLIKMLDKIKAAGITPGIHFLQTFIGTLSRYVTPAADHRLNVTRRFTLARPLGADDTDVYVEENPEDTVMADECRVLKIGGELAEYDNYTTEVPYRFTGLKRGAYATNTGAYPAGLVIGILDISEFGATSIYIDQNTNLQDEIAEKLAHTYDAGFRFIYFDGSEGTNAPYAFHVPNAQYRVYKKLLDAPLFTEGAAKAHFSWHMLSGGNAFDVFPPKVFKQKIRQFPCEEAPRMAQDFTRLNFGWWGYWAPGKSSVVDWLPIEGGDDPNWEPGTQPDMIEYATGRAAAWDCPVGLMENLTGFSDNPRTADNFEIFRRWEDVRAKKWLTDEQKEDLKNLGQEHILLINEKNEYELVPYDEIKNAAGDNKNVRAFAFTRGGENWAVYWHASGGGRLELPADAGDIEIMDDLREAAITVETTDGGVVVPICKRRYVKSNLSKAALVEAFEKAKLV